MNKCCQRAATLKICHWPGPSTCGSISHLLLPAPHQNDASSSTSWEKTNWPQQKRQHTDFFFKTYSKALFSDSCSIFIVEWNSPGESFIHVNIPFACPRPPSKRVHGLAPGGTSTYGKPLAACKRSSWQWEVSPVRHSRTTGAQMLPRSRVEWICSFQKGIQNAATAQFTEGH